MSATEAREFILDGADRERWLKRAEEIPKTCASLPARRVAGEIVMRLTDPEQGAIAA